MAVRINTTRRNGFVTDFANAFPAGSTIEIRTGTQPASANTAASGTLLATITLPASPWTSPSSGSISKQGVWSAVATETGIAGWARLIGGSNVVDGSVGTTGTDWIIDDSSVVSGGTVTIVTTSITFPSGE